MREKLFILFSRSLERSLLFVYFKAAQLMVHTCSQYSSCKLICQPSEYISIYLDEFIDLNSDLNSAPTQ